MTIGLPREATPAPVPDQPVAPVRPVLTRDELHQILFDFFRIGLAREPQPMRKSDYMSINDNSFILSKGVAENNVRRFSANPRESVQFFHRVGNVARVFCHDRRSGRPNAPGLAPKEARGTNQSFESRR